MPSLNLPRSLTHPGRGLTSSVADRPQGPLPQGAVEDSDQGLRTRTVILMRWVVVICQTVTVLVCDLIMHLPVATEACLTIIGALATFNIFLMISPLSRRSSRSWELTLQLSIDFLELVALFYFTGGAENPFLLFLVGPITLAAAYVPTRQTVFLVILAIACSLLLAFFSQPLHLSQGGSLEMPLIYRVARALGVAIFIAFSAVGSTWSASESRRTSLALHVTEAVLAREQRLSALGALAAAAAHELGTPLATITVVAKELASEAKGQMQDDAWLLVAQAQRCRDILTRLTEQPETGDVMHERMGLLELVRDIVAPYAGRSDIRVEALVTGPPNLPAPDVWRLPEISHAATTLVENAYDFATREVLVAARFTEQHIVLEIRDDGPGFSGDILARLGEPYVTSRPAGENSRTGHTGMGLGFFIAKTLLERTGAEVDYRNGPRGGAIVKARWPRSLIEAHEPNMETLEFPGGSAPK